MEQANVEERLARLEQAVQRSLELLGSGRVDEARALLAESSGAIPAAAGPARSITDDELELAFADAEPELERMRNADDVAQQAILQADRALEAEGQMAPDEVGDHFATETMASLLEQQGDEAAAERIRAALDGPDGAEDLGGPSRAATVATLERWLENLAGGARA
jgi:hypothetical protein